MLLPLALAAALSFQAPPAPADDAARGLTQGIVRICDHEFDCEEFDAALLERQASPGRPAGAGQKIFVDPDTGQIADPTQEQIAELDALILLDELTRPQTEAPRLEILSDGTIQADVRHLAVHIRAVSLTEDPASLVCPAESHAKDEKP